MYYDFYIFSTRRSPIPSPIKPYTNSPYTNSPYTNSPYTNSPYGYLQLQNSCYVGTVDTWLIWNLMGGARYTSAATAASPSPSTAANVPAPGSSQATPTSGSGRSSSSPSATSAMSNYITDVTNASRTMFMNLKTLQWDVEVSLPLPWG